MAVYTKNKKRKSAKKRGFSQKFSQRKKQYDTAYI